jgi:hypothetical protein
MARAGIGLFWYRWAPQSPAAKLFKAGVAVLIGGGSYKMVLSSWDNCIPQTIRTTVYFRLIRRQLQDGIIIIGQLYTSDSYGGSYKMLVLDNCFSHTHNNYIPQTHTAAVTIC